MKKILKNNLIGFILGGLIFGSIGVYATTLYNANQISYEGADGSTNVKEALDDLYTKSFNSASGEYTLMVEGSCYTNTPNPTWNGNWSWWAKLIDSSGNEIANVNAGVARNQLFPYSQIVSAKNSVQVNF